jgi:hypothetical protein
VLTGAGLLTIACRSSHPPVPPAIEFTRLPPAGEGSADVFHTIEGRVSGARSGQRIVLFSRSGVWWVQPLGDRPFTAIQRDSTWTSSIHPGTAYAALLVDASYRPPLTLNMLPPAGGAVQAVATADSSMLDRAALKTLSFSGYDWVVRQTPGSPAGTRNLYDAGNAWVDENGGLHLRIAQTPTGWTSAQVDLSRSLGYGAYRFMVRDVSHLEPPVVLTISTWDGSGPNREMDIEVSRWGEVTGKNSQYVVQPYYLAANVVQFLSPAGRLNYSFDWQPGRVTFETARGSGTGKPDIVSAHTFTSGVPSPGGETVHINLYIFENRRTLLRHGTEVIIEKFEYLP